MNLQPINIIISKMVRPREQDQFFSVPKKKLLSLTYSTKTTQVINQKDIQRKRKKGRICHLIHLLFYDYSSNKLKVIPREEKKGRICHLKIKLLSYL